MRRTPHHPSPASVPRATSKTNLTTPPSVRINLSDDINLSEDGDPVGPTLNPNYRPTGKSTYWNTAPSPTPSASDSELSEQDPHEEESSRLHAAHLSAAQTHLRDRKTALVARYGRAIPARYLGAADEEYQKRVRFAEERYGPGRVQEASREAGRKKDKQEEVYELWDVMRERDVAEKRARRWRWRFVVAVVIVGVVLVLLLGTWVGKEELRFRMATCLAEREEEYWFAQEGGGEGGL
ncbi:hypothetical protein P171DRAFT_488446 [Karstenula rhodostoma CBS 690.94]|uniref:Uncharacterized protein n=1 Tax=Karstenula rhodostoma CBS 690.94 TaxID=1392251 RepID=A0A9P4U9A7_9PLEO|nr:hypothetical protein P171DRAFT_488446 [Karstenula rhodostoma CBS 690.94]